MIRSLLLVGCLCLVQLWPPAPSFGQEQRLTQYIPVELTADLSQLSDNQKAMLKLLIQGLMICPPHSKGTVEN